MRERPWPHPLRRRRHPGHHRDDRDDPPRRFGLSAEVAAAVLFLASQQAFYTTGSTVPVDGGADPPSCTVSATRRFGKARRAGSGKLYSRGRRPLRAWQLAAVSQCPWLHERTRPGGAQMRIERDVMVPTRDGAPIAVDVLIEWVADQPWSSG